MEVVSEEEEVARRIGMMVGMVGGMVAETTEEEQSVVSDGTRVRGQGSDARAADKDSGQRLRGVRAVVVLVVVVREFVDTFPNVGSLRCLFLPDWKERTEGEE